MPIAVIFSPRVLHNLKKGQYLLELFLMMAYKKCDFPCKFSFPVETIRVQNIAFKIGYKINKFQVFFNKVTT